MEHIDKNRIALGVTIGGFTFTPPSTNPQLNSVEGVFIFAQNILNWFIGLSALVAVVMIIYGAFLLITAAGDPDKISNGGKAITASVIGLVIVFLVRTIVLFILQNFLS